MGYLIRESRNRWSGNYWHGHVSYFGSLGLDTSERLAPFDTKAQACEAIARIELDFDGPPPGDDIRPDYAAVPVGYANDRVRKRIVAGEGALKIESVGD